MINYTRAVSTYIRFEVMNKTIIIIIVIENPIYGTYVSMIIIDNRSNFSP